MDSALKTINRTSRRQRWIAAGVGLLIIGLIVVVIVRGHAKAGRTKGAGGSIPVTVAAARTGDMPIYFDGLGTVTALNSVTLHSRVDGQLMSVEFREGQFVHEGDVLARIDPRPFQAQLDQAEGTLAKDQATLANAKVDLERYQGLITQDAIPKQQLDTQVATVGQLDGTVKTDQAAVEFAQLQLSYSRITAPISGRVGLRLVDPGNMIHATDANGLLVIAELEPITVIFTLPEDSIPKVMEKLHGKVPLVVDIYNRDKTMKLATGHLLTVDNQIDPTTGTLKLRAIFDNVPNSLFPNQFVNARLLLETRTNQVLIPAASVQRGSQGTFVYNVKADNTVEIKPVTVGATEGNDTEIDQGVQAGDNVILDGGDKVQPGSTVTIATPTNAPGSPDASASQGANPPHGKKHHQAS